MLADFHDIPVKTTRFREYPQNCPAVKNFEILNPVVLPKEI